MSEADTVPWVEKYRPKSVDDVSHQEEVVKVLKQSLHTGNIPHLLFYGPPGTGKTTTILALARQLFGPALFRKRVLELNASDERGIQVVREKIKAFAQASVAKEVSNSKYPCPPFKIIILDECDTMTHDAQTALRRTMEKFTKETRFCLVCNYVSRIIDPITSRCAKFRFQPVHPDSMRARLETIAASERLELDAGVLDRVMADSEGDMRKAITTLQCARRLHGAKISEAHVVEVAGRVPDALVHQFVSKCKKDSFDSVQGFVTGLIADGFPASQVVSQLVDAVVDHGELSDLQKAAVLRRLAEADKQLLDGCSEFLQLMDVASTVMTSLRDPKLA